MCSLWLSMIARMWVSIHIPCIFPVSQFCQRIIKPREIWSLILGWLKLSLIILGGKSWGWVFSPNVLRVKNLLWFNILAKLKRCYSLFPPGESATKSIDSWTEFCGKLSLKWTAVTKILVYLYLLCHKNAIVRQPLHLMSKEMPMHNRNFQLCFAN